MDAKLEKLHNVLTEILDFVDQVCQAHHLQYYLLFGSALGAYRHQGFIPWDDDVDIGMPRRDYERFLELIRSSDAPYDIQDYRSEPNCFLDFGKIRKRGTRFVESMVDVPYQCNGIYIDIFPIDAVKSKTCWLRRLLLRSITHAAKFQKCRTFYQTRDSRLRFLLDRLICFPAKWIPGPKLMELSQRLRTKDRPETAAYLLCDQYVMERDIYAEPCYLEFEGRRVPVPGQIEAYLTRIYGSTYMQLPPEEERHTHMPSVLEFEDSSDQPAAIYQ